MAKSPALEEISRGSDCHTTTQWAGRWRQDVCDQGQEEHRDVTECVSGVREGFSEEATLKSFHCRRERSMLTGHVEGAARGQDISSLRGEWGCGGG